MKSFRDPELLGNLYIFSSILEETEEAYVQHVKTMQMESEDLKSSKKIAEEALKTERMWSKAICGHIYRNPMMAARFRVATQKKR